LFDAAGNVVKPGDIIFTGEYQSSTLTNIEARIWIKRNSLSITPAQFNWSGQFDGATTGAQYGYASILPKTVGAFYTGLGSTNNTWAGPFQLVLQSNALATNYSKDQFMEFSVNLTKLGLDPVTTFGGDVCGTPFNRLVIKTRSSASFTSELKDFVSPIDLFLAPRVNIATDQPNLCDSAYSYIFVTNPAPSSTYVWSTSNGHIVGSNTGTGIYVDQPGTYIVTQYLQVGCSPYATDTIQISYINNCQTLAENNIANFSAILQQQTVQLNWLIKENRLATGFDVERSVDGVHFVKLQYMAADSYDEHRVNYHATDNIAGLQTAAAYYRIKVYSRSGSVSYSNIVRINLNKPEAEVFTILPNPVKDFVQLAIHSKTTALLNGLIIDNSGKTVCSLKGFLQAGRNVITVEGVDKLPNGFYTVLIKLNNDIFSKKMVVMK